jgi:hypothetical protein
MTFRAFSATEGKGDYFVGLFFGGCVPTGSAPNELGHAVLSPTLGVGKGFGPWDNRASPPSGTNVLGRTLVVNTAVDYRTKGQFWPMLEQNSTSWVDGPLNGTSLTPGLVLGPFPLTGTLHFGVGAMRANRSKLIPSVQPPLDLVDTFSVPDEASFVTLGIASLPSVSTM